MTTSIALDKCPQCGGPKLAKSRICSNCYAADSLESKAKHRRSACPVCGQPKDYRAKTCRRCYGLRSRKHPHPRVRQAPPNLELCTAEWVNEFRGFFLGEGTVSLYPSTPAGKTSVQPKLTVSQRADNMPYMEDIQRRLGGLLYVTERERQNKSPIARWSRNGLDECLTVLRLIYDSTNLHTKMREVALAIEFIEWRKSLSHRLTGENREIALDYVERIRAMRDFKVDG